MAGKNSGIRDELLFSGAGSHEIEPFSKVNADFSLYPFAPVNRGPGHLDWSYWSIRFDQVLSSRFRKVGSVSKVGS